MKRENSGNLSISSKQVLLCPALSSITFTASDPPLWTYWYAESRIMITEMQRVWNRFSKVGLSSGESTIQCPFPPHPLGPWSRQGTFNGERYNLRNVALCPACKTQCLEGRRLIKSVRKLRTGFLALRNTQCFLTLETTLTPYTLLLTYSWVEVSQRE